MTARDVIAGEVSAGCNTVDWERGRTDSQEVADAILAALDAAGYAVVPVEPTKAMRVAACQTKSDGETQSYVLEYRAMIKAAKETT